MSTERIALNVLTDAILADLRERAKSDAAVIVDAIILDAGARIEKLALAADARAASPYIINIINDAGLNIRDAIADAIEAREVKRITNQLTGRALV
jgi:hypothetical protein